MPTGFPHKFKDFILIQGNSVSVYKKCFANYFDYLEAFTCHWERMESFNKMFSAIQGFKPLVRVYM